jgi:hypothetical protein
MGLRDFSDSTLSEIRMDANHHRRERISVATCLSEIAGTRGLQAEYRGLGFTSTRSIRCGLSTWTRSCSARR